jgi:hypothetical protein
MPRLENGRAEVTELPFESKNPTPVLYMLIMAQPYFGAGGSCFALFAQGKSTN